MSDKVTIELELLTKAFKTAIADVTKQTKGFESQAEESFKSVGSSFSVMAGNLAANAIVGAISAITGQFGRMINEATDAENAFNSLKFAMKSAGIYSEAAANSMSGFATSLSQVTTYDDDLIVANQALLLSLTNLNKDGVNKSVAAAANLAAVLNIDLGSATSMIAKALNGNTAAFSKLGIEIQKGSSDAQQYANVMQALEKFSGASTAATGTFSGALAQQDNAMGNLLGSMGELITKNPAIIQGLKDFTSVVVSATEWLMKNKEAISGVVTSGIELTKTTFEVASATAVAVTEIGKYTTGAAEAALANKDLVDELDAQVEVEVQLHKARMNSYNITNQSTKANETFIESILGGTFATRDAMITAGASNAVVGESVRIKKGLTDAQIASIEASNAYVESLAKENESVAASNALKLEMLTTLYADKDALDTQAETTNYEAKLARENEFFAQKSTLMASGLQDEMNKINASTVADETKHKARATAQAKYNLAFNKADSEHHKKQQDLEKQSLDLKKKNDEELIGATSNLFGSLAQIAAVGGKKNFEIVKAFNLAEAVTSGWLAVQKALASSPNPVTSGIAAAAAGIAAAANVARISATKAPAFKDGGVVPGNSVSGDKVMARVNSGEMILNKQQQANLFNQASMGGGGGRVEALLQVIASSISSGMSVNIDGRELITIVRDGLSSGRTI